MYLGAVITLVFSVLMRQLPLYSDIEARKIVYWLSDIGVSCMATCATEGIQDLLTLLRSSAPGP
jgi:hypothetical protein